MEREILLLGDPRLYEISEEVKKEEEGRGGRERGSRGYQGEERSAGANPGEA